MRLLILLALVFSGCKSPGVRVPEAQPAPPPLEKNQVASPAPTPHALSKSEYKVWIYGTVPPSITCPVISEKFVVKLLGPADRAALSKELDEKSSFEMVGELPAGKYQVSLANQKTGKVVDSQTIEVPLRKRYQIKFSACSSLQ